MGVFRLIKTELLINCALMGNIIMEKRCWISARKKQELLIWTTRTKMILISCGFCGAVKSRLCVEENLRLLSVNTWTKKVCGRRSQILITASIMMKVFAARFFMNLGFMMTIPISSMDIHRSMPLRGKIRSGQKEGCL